MATASEVKPPPELKVKFQDVTEDESIVDTVAAETEEPIELHVSEEEEVSPLVKPSTPVDSTASTSSEHHHTAVSEESPRPEIHIEGTGELTAGTSETAGTSDEEKDGKIKTSETTTLPSINSITGESEAELLAKLEQANKLLEADAKSLKCITDSTKSSRRGSNASLRSTGSTLSNMSNVQVSCSAINSSNDTLDDLGMQDKWLIWGKIVNDWEEYSKKKSKQLKDLVRLGIPHHFRGIVWQLQCNAFHSPLKDKYAEYLKMTSPCEKVIRRDIARTYPEHDFFKEKDGPGQETLFNVMKAYSIHDREVGYCQGCGFIVGLLLMQMPEEEAFCVLVKLMQDYRLRELFKPSMAELGLCMFQLECMLQDLLPELYRHFTSQGFHTSIFASPWFLTLFAVALPISLARRIMDVFISEGMEIIFRVGIAILQLNYDDLLRLDMEEMLRLLQKIAPKLHEAEPEVLMMTAYQVKYNTKKMKKLEKDYLAFKTKENEDQIEMRRLRTENRLLLRRIQVLEEENEVLADRLIQGQLQRAQEAEDSYMIKKELESIKYHNKETAKQLEGAQTVISDLRDKVRNDTTEPIDPESAGIIMALQEELIAVRLREAESSETLKDLQDDIKSLEKANKKLQEEPGHSVEALQDELIAVKLREAEANLSLKELRHTVNELEDHWQKHLQRASSRRKESNTKQTVQTLTEELMSVRLREAETMAELKEAKQRVMELETQNQCTSNQFRRSEEERLEMKAELDKVMRHEKELQSSLNVTTKDLCKLQAKSQEELYNIRIRETEANACLAELAQKMAELEIQNQELLTKRTLSESETETTLQELRNRISELNTEVKQLRLKLHSKPGDQMSYSDYDDNQYPVSVITNPAAALDDEDFDDNDSNQGEMRGIDMSVIESDDEVLERRTCKHTEV
ncbi:EVI5-like protein isoform X2 [Asterias rubens]|uniref:EVI5-like protein isoform X2 n=1 Tax=Asterias rubens TaxID=7604 RepID=UPI00145588E8|nr:EVI5-like protein isoform X2 [Asterias rubens]